MASTLVFEHCGYAIQPRYNALAFQTRPEIYNTALGYFANVTGAGIHRTHGDRFEATITASNQVALATPTSPALGGVVGWSMSDGRFKKESKKTFPG